MTNTLVLDVTGPQQSWVSGGSSTRKQTMRRPTKSGIIGILANALGRDRFDSIDDLVDLSFSVVEQRPGRVVTDYTIIGGGTMPTTLTERLANPSLGHEAGYSVAYATVTAQPDLGYRITRRDESRSSISQPEFLADASFLVGLSSDDYDLLSGLKDALREPARPIFLGKRRYHPDSFDLKARIEQVPDVTGIGEPGLRYWSENIELHRDGRPNVTFEQPISYQNDDNKPRYNNYRSLRLVEGVTK